MWRRRSVGAAGNVVAVLVVGRASQASSPRHCGTAVPADGAAHSTGGGDPPRKRRVPLRVRPAALPPEFDDSAGVAASHPPAGSPGTLAGFEEHLRRSAAAVALPSPHNMASAPDDGAHNDRPAPPTVSSAALDTLAGLDDDELDRLWDEAGSLPAAGTREARLAAADEEDQECTVGDVLEASLRDTRATETRHRRRQRKERIGNERPGVVVKRSIHQNREFVVAPAVYPQPLWRVGPTGHKRMRPRVSLPAPLLRAAKGDPLAREMLGSDAGPSGGVSRRGRDDRSTAYLRRHGDGDGAPTNGPAASMRERFAARRSMGRGGGGATRYVTVLATETGMEAGAHNDDADADGYETVNKRRAAVAQQQHEDAMRDAAAGASNVADGYDDDGDGHQMTSSPPPRLPRRGAPGGSGAYNDERHGDGRISTPRVAATARRRVDFAGQQQASSSPRLTRGSSGGGNRSAPRHDPEYDEVLASEAQFLAAGRAAATATAPGGPPPSGDSMPPPGPQGRPRHPPGMEDMTDVLQSEAAFVGRPAGRGGGVRRHGESSAPSMPHGGAPGGARRHVATTTLRSPVRRVDATPRPASARGVRVAGGAAPGDVPSAFRATSARRADAGAPATKPSPKQKSRTPPPGRGWSVETAARPADVADGADAAPQWTTMTAAVAAELLPRATSALRLIGATADDAPTRHTGETQLLELVAAVVAAAERRDAALMQPQGAGAEGDDGSSDVDQGPTDDTTETAHNAAAYPASDASVDALGGCDSDPTAALLRDPDATMVSAAALLALVADAGADQGGGGTGIGSRRSAQEGVATWGPVKLSWLLDAIRAAPGGAHTAGGPRSIAERAAAAPSAADRAGGVAGRPRGLPAAAATLLRRELHPRGGLHAFLARGGPLGGIAHVAVSPVGGDLELTLDGTPSAVAPPPTYSDPAAAPSKTTSTTAVVTTPARSASGGGAAEYPWRRRVAASAADGADGDDDGAPRMRNAYLRRRFAEAPPPLDAAGFTAVLDLWAASRPVYGDRLHFSAAAAAEDAEMRGRDVTTFVDDLTCRAAARAAPTPLTPPATAALRRKAGNLERAREAEREQLAADDAASEKDNGNEAAAKADEERVVDNDETPKDALFHGPPPSELVRERGFTTREVADWYTPFVPTFYVDEKALFRTLPPPVGSAAMNPFHRDGRRDRFFRPSTFFARFPGVFDVRGSSTHERKMVRLAKALEHPRRGQADRVFAHLAPEGFEEAREREIDAAFVAILQRNLPSDDDAELWRRGSGDAATLARLRLADERGFVPLVEWVNTFPPDDLRILNAQPPLRVLQVLRRHAATFQLIPRVAGVIAAAAKGPQGVTALQLTASTSPSSPDAVGNRAQQQREDEEDASTAHEPPPADGDGSTPGAAAPASFDVLVRRRPPHIAPRSTAECAIATSPCPALAAAVMRLVEALAAERREEELRAHEEAAAAAEEEAWGDAEDDANADDDDGAAAVAVPDEADADFAAFAAFDSVNEGTSAAAGADHPLDESSVAETPTEAPNADMVASTTEPEEGEAEEADRAAHEDAHEAARRPRRRAVVAGDVEATPVGRIPAAPAVEDVLLDAPRDAEPGCGEGRKALRRRRQAERAAAEHEDEEGAGADAADDEALGWEYDDADDGAAEPRWVATRDVYARLSPGERRLLRPFRTLAAFAALHGRLVEVSADRQFLIRHAPSYAARPPPPPFTEGPADGAGGGAMGTDRMRPDANVDESDDEVLYGATGGDAAGHGTPYRVAHTAAERAKLCADIAAALPEHAVSLMELKRRLPRAVVARLPTRVDRLLASAGRQVLTVWRDPHQHNTLMVQKASLGPAPAGLGLKDTLESAEECVDATLALIHAERRRHAALGTPDAASRGLTIDGLKSRAPPGLRNAWRRHHGGVVAFVEHYPQFFAVTELGPGKHVVHALSGGGGGGEFGEDDAELAGEDFAYSAAATVDDGANNNNSDNGRAEIPDAARGWTA